MSPVKFVGLLQVTSFEGSVALLLLRLQGLGFLVTNRISIKIYIDVPACILINLCTKIKSQSIVICTFNSIMIFQFSVTIIVSDLCCQDGIESRRAF